MAKPKLLYDSRFADAALVASSTATGFAAANLADFRPYTWWKPAALPVTVTVDCGTPKSADYLLVHGHDLASQGCTLELRASTDNFAASDVLIATKTPTTDAQFLMLFASVAYRYWRLSLTGPAAPSLAIVAVGAALECPIWLPQGFDPLGREVVSQLNRNSRGQPLGRVVDFEEWSQTITLQRVPWAWPREVFAPAWDAHLRSSPFVLAWDTDLYPDELRLGVAGSGFKTPHYAGGTCDVVFEMTGVIE